MGMKQNPASGGKDLDQDRYALAACAEPLFIHNWCWAYCQTRSISLSGSAYELREL